jgi:hypothetical protein
VIGLVVTLLPRVPLGSSSAAPREEVANQRPSLLPTAAVPVTLAPPLLPPRAANWRTAVSRPAQTSELPPADPAYVERRLDEAGQQLLSGVTTYLSRHAQEVLQAEPQPQISEFRPAPRPQTQLPSYTSPPSYTAPSFTPPRNAFRY